jgi:uroporphyrinogen-III synthase
MAEASASPLAGRNILITRASDQTDSLVRELEARGAKPVLQPMISFHPPTDFSPLDQALRGLRTFDWLLLTSANAVRALVERSQSLELDVMNSFTAVRIAAVGPVTAEAARRAGLPVSHVANKHQGLALAEEFATELARKRILLPRSNLATSELPNALRRIGGQVTEVIAYRTFAAEPEGEGQNYFSSGHVEAILFFSPSAVRNFLNWDEGKGGQVLRSISDSSRKTAVVAVGPVTATALRDAGLRNVVQASNTTVTSVVEALEKFFAPTPCEPKLGPLP